jgi:ketosteroid isomerase-like protein
LTPSSGTASNSREAAVLREFLGALDAGDDQAAAALLAPGAQVFEEPVSVDSLTKVHSLNCTARIESFAQSGETLTVTFVFTGSTKWASSPCDGTSLQAVATVRDGKIVSLVDAG